VFTEAGQHYADLILEHEKKKRDCSSDSSSSSGSGTGTGTTAAGTSPTEWWWREARRLTALKMTDAELRRHSAKMPKDVTQIVTSYIDESLPDPRNGGRIWKTTN